MGEFVKIAEKLNIQNYFYFYILTTDNQKCSWLNQNNYKSIRNIKYVRINVKKREEPNTEENYFKKLQKT